MLSLRQWFRLAIREPLVHFAVFGGAIFLIYQWQAPSPEDRIHLRPATVQAIYDMEAKRLGREPDAEERQAALRGYIENEALYREALALGLDTGDLIVKRRLVQKVRFLAESLAEPKPPSDEELRLYFAEHKADFAQPERLSFRHIFLRSENVTARRAVIEASLSSERPQGDPFLHGASFAGQTTGEVARIFGTEFSRALPSQPLRTWSGPLASPYGQHWVYITERIPPAEPSLDEVREEVAAAWRKAALERRTREAIEEIVERYNIHIEADGDSQAPADSADRHARSATEGG